MTIGIQTLKILHGRFPQTFQVHYNYYHQARQIQAIQKTAGKNLKNMLDRLMEASVSMDEPTRMDTPPRKELPGW